MTNAEIGSFQGVRAKGGGNLAEITVFRILPRRWIYCAFSAEDGHGETLRNGARWNPPGCPMVYASDHPSTAAWEVSRRFGYHLPTLYLDFAYCAVLLDEKAIITLEQFGKKPLPVNWYVQEPSGVYKPEIQDIGGQWILSAVSLALQVPSALNPRDAINYLINPKHPDYGVLMGKRIGAWTCDGLTQLPLDK